ncbi:MAG: tetratricopeptide repeat protein [Actinomycetota bacterium]|nr:tetratricopeptide repeat protein [Actinomycetota bacterium]
MKLLGGFTVRVGSRTIEQSEWRLRKAAALVKLLALAPDHRLHREQIMDQLWPRLGKRAAANNLRRTLHAARKTLDPVASSGYLTSEEEWLILCPEGMLWVDVGAFEEAAATARREREPATYRAALDLYTGELLPGDRYEEWAEGRRQELRRLNLTLLMELAGIHEERGAYGPAIETLSRVTAEEPASEEAHAGLMRLYALSERQTEALRQYEHLEEALSREFGIGPSASSRALREEISSGNFPPEGARNRGIPLEDPASGGKHNLPAPRTSFVGRHKEMVEVKRALAMTRLLTLTGAGGSGKTRLALEVARDLVGAYPDGVWLVQLAGLSEGELVPHAVAGVLRIRERPGQPVTDTLAETLPGKDMLLVLDNCEHLVGAAARLVDALLDSCPTLRVMATSREPLGVAGEAVWPVLPLSVPDLRRASTVVKLEGSESVRLFVERAHQRNPAFVLEWQNARPVAEICRRLDGIPLAIELAAARVGLSVQEISERLGDSLKLLTGGDRTATPRHRTLRGALDWSYELLSEDEKRLFRRHSVFAGGWTLGAAEAVGAGDSVEGEDVLDLLSRLVDKSLVVAEMRREGSSRYRFLEPVRQYAQERLEVSEEGDAVRLRHALWFLAFAEEAEPELRREHQGLWLERLETEHDNLRAAIQSFLEQEETEPALRLCGALGDFWHVRGYLSEGRRWLEAALDEGEGPATARTKVLSKAAFMGWEQGDFERSISLSQENLALSRRTGDKAGAAFALYNLGMTKMFQEEHERARVLFEEAVALQRELGDEVGLARTLQGLGLTVMSLGDFDHAEEFYEEGLALARKTGDILGIELLLLGLGLAALHQDNYECARVFCREILDTSLPLDHKHCIVASLHILASAAGSQGQAVRSARLWGAAEALREAIGVQLAPVERTAYARYIAVARSRLDDEAWQAAWAEGRMLSPAEAVEYGLPADEPAPPAALRFARREAVSSLVSVDTEVALPVRTKALVRAARIAWEQGDYETTTVLGEECLALSRELGDTADKAEALYVLGLTALVRIELERASAVFKEAAALQRELGDTVGLAHTVQGLGIVEIGRRDFVRAQELHEQSLALAREAGDDFGIMFALALGALAALGQGEHAQGQALWAEGLEVSRMAGMVHGLVFHLQISAVSAGAQGQPVRLARLWGAAEALSETIGVTLYPIERRFHGPYIDAARAQLDEATWEAALAEGQAMSAEKAVEYALSAEEPTPPISPTPKRPSAAEMPVGFTRREKEVAALVARGLTNRRIARELVLSEHTVHHHVTNILKKLGLRSREQVASHLGDS